ncbi:MAG: VTT domain-containing protein [Crocinitomicaceae bacterium]
MNKTKKVFYYLWLAVIAILLSLFLFQPGSFTPENIAQFMKQYNDQILIIYIFISLLRGLFLIPSTPFVLAGALLFPEQPWTVFTISIVGLIVGSTLVYYLSDALGFSKKLEKKYPRKIERWHKRLNSPWAAGIVVAWSFFPLVPTDVICYVAGIVKMPYRILISGVIIGELVLIYLYVFYGGLILSIF